MSAAVVAGVATAVSAAAAVANSVQQGKAAGKAGKASQQAATEANARLDRANEQSQAMLDPYANSGKNSLDKLDWEMYGDPATGGGKLNKEYTMQDYQQDPGYTPMVNSLESLQKTPGYMFELKQGQQALDNSAAARGSFLSGKQLKATSEYQQGVASTKYQQAWERAQAAYQNAFTRNLTQKQNRYQQMKGIVNTGLNATSDKAGYNMDAAGRTAGNTMANGQQQSDMHMNVGQANANMYTGIENAANTGLGAYGAYQGQQAQNQQDLKLASLLRNNQR